MEDIVQGQSAKARVRRMGFVTFVLAAARTPEEAGSKAIDRLRRDRLLLSRVRNAPDDRPLLFVEEISEAPSEPGRWTRRQQNFIFYREQGPRRRK